MHTIEKKDISISGEEIFLPTDPNDLGRGESNPEESSGSSLDYSPLPTKPEDIE
jgi:hypothetical protein